MSNYSFRLRAYCRHAPSRRRAPLPAAQGGHKLRHSDTKVSALPSAEEILAEKVAVIAVAEPTGAGLGAGASAGGGAGADTGAK